MNLLAIDTSTEIASIALQVGTECLSEEQPGLKSHAQLVLPIIQNLMAQADVSMSQLDGVVFGCGPGSFTGLRIACSIAKGIAYANDLGMIPVSTLASIAYCVRENKADAQAPVLAVLDARMNELYWGYFPAGVLLVEDRLNAAGSIQVPEDRNIVLAGVGIDAYWSDFSEDVKTQISKQLRCYPNAAAMIRLAQEAAIKPISAALAQPIYVRNQVTQGDSRG